MQTLQSEIISPATLYGLVRNVRPQVSDTSVRLCALARVYMAMYRLHFTLDIPSGDGRSLKEYSRKAVELFRVMRSKALAETEDLSCRCRLVVQLYDLMNGTDYVADAARQQAWEETADAVLDYYFRHRYADAMQAEAARADVCRCILDFFYFSAPEEEDGWWIFLKDTLTMWAETFVPSSGWKDTDFYTALERVDVMNRYSYMYLDPAFDKVARQAFAFYVPCAVQAAVRQPEVCGLLHDLALEGNAWPVDWTLAERMKELLYRTFMQLPSDCNDEKLYALSYLFPVDYGSEYNELE